jgi:signal transduction histidine kinase
MADGDLKLQFKPRARIIRTIGDQLISGPEAAVIELVKNAYDADASYVWIRFTPPLEIGKGRITIKDDGHGMSLSDVQDKWMEPATSSKSGLRFSRKLRRPLMGSKGIGRFAAAKLGQKMGLNSISGTEPPLEEVLIPEIDWSIFEGDAYLADIAIDYLTQTTPAPTGTEIEVRDLNEGWSEAKLSRLHLELRRLISPLEQSDPERAFKIYLDLSACTEESAGFDGATLIGVDAAEEVETPEGLPPPAFEVQPFPLLTTCDYEVSGFFDAAGVFEGTMQIKRGGQAPIAIDLTVPLDDDEEPCGIVGVQFYIFDREAQTVRQTMSRSGLGDLTATQGRKILDEIAGVAIYRRGFRVRPYGDPENDWLTLDRLRVQNPSLKIGHNQVAGYITVDDQAGSGLVERSSREGFEQNGAFIRLGRMIQKLLAEQVEPRRYSFRKQTGISRPTSTTFEEVRVLSGLEKIRELITTLPLADQPAAEAVVAKESAQLIDKIAVLEERQRVLEAKSSLGAIISEVLHEGAPAVSYLSTTSSRLQNMFPDLKVGGDRQRKAEEVFPDRLHQMRTNALRLSELFKALRPLSGGRRGQPQFFRPIEPIAAAKALFDTHETRIEIEGGLEAPEVVGYPDDLMTAMVNLFSNSIHWLEEAKISEPRINVRLFTQNSDLVIWVEDNGPGVTSEFAEDIFDVGFSLKPNGTGLGLNIAKEALARSEGALLFHMEFQDGARFEIRFALSGGKTSQ